MKKQIYVLILLLSTVIAAKAQGYYTVNNGGGFTANFTDLQTAVNTVPAGSVLLIHPSGSTYGSVNISKPLTLVGNGYFLGNNPAPNTQNNLGTSIVDRIYFFTGSSNSMITGLYVGGFTIYDTVTNVTITRNYLYASSSSSRGNHTITQNFFNYCSIDMSSGTVIFKNNIMYSPNGGFNQYPFIRNNATAIIDHNLFDYTRTSNDEAFNSGGTIVYKNNILLSNAASKYTMATGSNITYSNNISTDSTYAGTLNAKVKVSRDSLFANFISTSQDGKYQLKANSPAKNYGDDGDNAGPFTNNKPYVLSGIPFIPNIFFLDIPTIGTTGTGLPIHIKAKANN